MPSVIGTNRSYHDKFKFILEISGFRYAGFSKCSELSAELATIEHHEGGVLIPNKSPGRLTYAPITLERGATDDLDMFGWFQECANAAAGVGGIGLVDDQYKRNAEIIQLNRDDSVRRRWSIRRAWPKKFVAGDWDNGSDEKVIEQLVLEYDYFALKS